MRVNGMLKFNRELNVSHGVNTRLSPLVSHVLAPNPGPFTFKGTGVYLVGAGDEAHDHDFVPDVMAHDGMRIAGDGFTFECVATPGHTANHVCYALMEERALFSGDHVMGWSTSVIAPPDGDMGQYIGSLEKLLARDETL